MAKSNADLTIYAAKASDLQSSNTLKLFLAAEVTKTPLRVVKEQIVGSRGFDRVTHSTLCAVVSGVQMIHPNTAVSYLLERCHPRHRDHWQVAKVNAMLEWEASTLYPAIVTDTGVPSVAIEPALHTMTGYLQKNPIFDPLDPLSIILFACLYPLVVSSNRRELARNKVPLVVQWVDKASQHLSCVTALSLWKHSASIEQLKASLPTPKVKPSVTIELVHHKSTILPQNDRRNILVTSALPYVNNIPHLGNIIGCVLSADVFARYCRLRGYNVLYICGTDEYGTATETKAIEENTTCKELCDKYYSFHESSYKWFQIDFDYFGRTTTAEQTRISQDIFLKLEKNSRVLEDTMTQLYCPQHQSFLADRFVEGICPLCGFEDARGDQCDGCGKLLNAIELVKPRCKLDNASPIPRDSKHLFLNLTDYQAILDKWFKKTSEEGFWSLNSKTITNSWLKEGLKPRCITRDLKWGTPVPKKGYEEKVFYVWFDAPIGYLSITANYTPEWEKWWKNPDNVKLYQFMGKDNVPFHTIIFPSTLIGTEEKWTLLHHLSTTEYLQYEQGKFSKSRGVGVFGNNVVASGIPVEVWRYYLLSMRPETGDTQFTWDGLVALNNGELLANLGNMVNRIIKFINAKYDKVIPAYSTDSEPEKALKQDVQALLTQYVEALEGVKIRQGLRIVMEISARGNMYLQQNKLDNNLFTNARSRCDTVVSVASNLCYLISALVYAYMPSTSESILRQLNLPLRRVTDTWDADDIEAGHVIGGAEYLFKRIEETRIDELRQKYSGNKKANIPETPKSKKGRKAPSGGGVVPAAQKKTPEIVSLEEKVSEQGNKVRQLKTSKADANEIKDAVNVLLELKKQLSAMIESIQ